MAPHDRFHFTAMAFALAAASGPAPAQDRRPLTVRSGALVTAPAPSPTPRPTPTPSGPPGGTPICHCGPGPGGMGVPPSVELQLPTKTIPEVTTPWSVVLDKDLPVSPKQSGLLVDGSGRSPLVNHAELAKRRVAASGVDRVRTESSFARIVSP